MKPKPFWALKNLTVPVAMMASFYKRAKASIPHANHSHGPHIRIRRVLGEGPLAGETARQAKSERCLYRDRPGALQSPRERPRRAPRRVNFSLTDSGDFACIYDICAMQRMR